MLHTRPLGRPIRACTPRTDTFDCVEPLGFHSSVSCSTQRRVQICTFGWGTSNELLQVPVLAGWLGLG